MSGGHQAIDFVDPLLVAGGAGGVIKNQSSNWPSLPSHEIFSSARYILDFFSLIAWMVFPPPPDCPDNDTLHHSALPTKGGGKKLFSSSHVFIIFLSPSFSWSFQYFFLVTLFQYLDPPLLESINQSIYGQSNSFMIQSKHDIVF